MKFSFEASHSLDGYEEPHPHLWRLEVSLEAEPLNGMVVDIVKARALIQGFIGPVQDTYLNSNEVVYDSVRKAPTCETLANYFWNLSCQMCEVDLIRDNPSVRVASVSVAIFDGAGVELGMVRLSR